MPRKNVSISLVVGPLGSRTILPLALPVLSSFAESHGYQVHCWDFNIDFMSKELGLINIPDLLKMDNWYGVNVSELVIQNVSNFVHEWAERILTDKPTIVGFSSQITNIYSNLALATAVKSLDSSVITVFGGPECSYNWKLLIQRPEVDFIILGDGEDPLVQLIEFISRSDLRGLPPSIISKNSQGKLPLPAINVNLDSLPLPNYFSLDLNHYKFKGEIELPLYGSIGCTHHCTFCSRNFTQGKYRYKSYSKIIDELEQCIKVYGVSKFYFVDSLINGNLEQLKAWTTWINDQGLNISWRANAVLRPGMTDDLLKIMYRSGCRSINYGLESGSPHVLKEMRKYANLDNIEKVIKSTHDSGINVTCFIIVGYPSETEEDFDLTREFIIRNRNYICAVTPNTCYVGPGTILHKDKSIYGVIGDGDKWSNQYSDPAARQERFDQLVQLLHELSIPIVESV